MKYLKLYESYNELDPFDEEDWDIEEEIPRQIKIGDNVRLRKNLEYFTQTGIIQDGYKGKLIIIDDNRSKDTITTYFVKDIIVWDNIELIKFDGFWPWYDSSYWEIIH